MWTVFATLCVAALLLVGAAVYAFGYVWGSIDRPGPLAADAVVELPPGSGLIAIASRLERAGAITDALVFRILVSVTGGERELKAGEYAIPAQASMREIYELIRSGRVVDHVITIPEGLTSAMIVEILNESDVLSGQIAETPAEGTLLPETYHVTRGTDREVLLDRMARYQEELLDELWDARDPDLPLTSREDVINLASIVEKETGVASERGRVAAVFVNRLRAGGWRIQSDPTIIYGVSGGYPLLNDAGEQRGIRQSELQDASNLYNTYRHDGLPPTPICNPGADAIRAVLNPDETDEFYFVADGTGGHAFARTDAEHRRNVAAWRRIERSRAP